MPDPMIRSNVVLRSHFGLARQIMVDRARRAVAETGRQIAERTRENMTPGHFLDTGLSQDETRWEQLTEDSGQVHIPTDYASAPEFGTVHMAARPVLLPAIMELWPDALHKNWRRADALPEINPPGPAMDPISRP